MIKDFSIVRKILASRDADDDMSEVACALVDEQLAVVALTRKTLTAWDLETGREVIRIVAQDDFRFLQLDIACYLGKSYAVTTNTAGQVMAWELTHCRPIAKLYPLHARQRIQAFTAVDRFFLVGRGAGPTSSVYATPSCDGVVDVWDMTKSQRTHYLSHGGYSESVSVTTYNGRLVAVTGSVHAERPLLDPYDSESYLTAWDLSTGNRLAEPTLTDGVSIPVKDSCLTDTLVAAVVNNRLCAILVGSSGLTIWDLYDGQQVKRIICQGHIEGIVWSEVAAGVVLVRGTTNMQDGDCWLRVLDISSGAVLADTGNEFGSINSCAVATCGSVIVSAGINIQHLRFSTKEKA